MTGIGRFRSRTGDLLRLERRMSQVESHGRYRRSWKRAATNLSAAVARCGSQAGRTTAGDHSFSAPRADRLESRSISRTGIRSSPRRYESTVASSADRMSLSQRSARKRGSRLRPAIILAAAGDDARLRSAQQFVSTEADQIDTALDDFSGHWLVLDAVDSACLDHSATPKVFHEWNPLAPGHGSDFFRRRRFHEAIHEEIAAVHLQDQRCATTDGPCVIGDRRVVRGAHFAQPCTAGFENLGNAKSSADLDQFSPRDHHLRSRFAAEVPEDQHQSGRVVVDDRGRFGTAQQGQALFEIAARAGSGAVSEVVLERVVGGSNRRNRMHRDRTERRTAEIGVHENPGSVDNRLNACGMQAFQVGAHAGDHGVEARDRLSRSKTLKMPTHHVDDHWTRKS